MELNKKMVFYYTEDEELLNEEHVYYFNGKYYSAKGLKAALINASKKIPNKWGVNE